MPKVAVSGYTMTIIRKPYRHRSTAICFHCTISLKSSGFDNCMSGFRSYGGVYCWCSCCPATFLFSGYAPAVSAWPSYCRPICRCGSGDLYISLPVILPAVSQAILPAIIDGDLFDYLRVDSGSKAPEPRGQRVRRGRALAPAIRGAKVSSPPQ